MKEVEKGQTIYDIGNVLRNADKQEFPDLSKTPLGKALDLNPETESLDEAAKTKLIDAVYVVSDSLIPNLDEEIAESRIELDKYTRLSANVQSHVNTTTTNQQTIKATIEKLKEAYETATEEIRRTGRVDDQTLIPLNKYVDTLESIKPDADALTPYTQEVDRLRGVEASNFQSNPEQNQDWLQEIRDGIDILKQRVDWTAEELKGMTSNFNLAANDFVEDAQTSLSQEQQFLKDLQTTRTTQAEYIRKTAAYQETLTQDIQTLQESIEDGNMEKIFPNLGRLKNTLNALSNNDEFQGLIKTALEAQAAYLTNHVRNLEELKLNSISFAEENDIFVLAGNIEDRFPNLQKIDLSNNKAISTEEFLELLDQLSANRNKIEINFSNTNLAAALDAKETNLTVENVLKKTREWDQGISTIQSIPAIFKERITKLNITLDATLNETTPAQLSKKLDKFPKLELLDLSKGAVEKLETIEILFNSLKNDDVMIKVRPEDQKTLGLEKPTFNKEEFFNFLKARQAEQSLQKDDQEKHEKQEAVEPQRTKQPEEVQQKATEPEQTASESPQEKAATTIQRAFRNFKDRRERSFNDLLKETESLLAEEETQGHKIEDMAKRLDYLHERTKSFLEGEEAQKEIYKNAEPEGPEEQHENLAAELARENLTPDFQETPESFLDEDKAQREVEEKALDRAEAQQAAQDAINSATERNAKLEQQLQEELETKKNAADENLYKAEAAAKASAAKRDAEAERRAEQRDKAEENLRELRAKEAETTAKASAAKRDAEAERRAEQRDKAEENLRELRAKEAETTAKASAAKRDAEAERRAEQRDKAEENLRELRAKEAETAAKASAAKRDDEAERRAEQRDKAEENLRELRAKEAETTAKASAAKRDAEAERRAEQRDKAEENLRELRAKEAETAAKASAAKRDAEAEMEAEQRELEAQKAKAEGEAKASAKAEMEAREKSEREAEKLEVEREKADKAAPAEKVEKVAADKAAMVRTKAEDEAEAARLRMEELEVDVAGYKQQVTMIRRDLKAVSDSWGAWLGGRKEEISELQNKLEEANKKLDEAERALKSAQQKTTPAPTESERQAAQHPIATEPGPTATLEKAAPQTQTKTAEMTKEKAAQTFQRAYKAKKQRAAKFEQQQIATKPVPAATTEKAAPQAQTNAAKAEDKVAADKAAAEKATAPQKATEDKAAAEKVAEAEKEAREAADKAVIDKAAEVTTKAEEEAEAARLRKEDLEADVAGTKQEVNMIERDLEEVSNSWHAMLGGRKEEISALQEKLENAKKELAKAKLALRFAQAPTESEKQAAQTIQKVYRGHLGRKEANKRRAAAAEAQKGGVSPKKSKASTAHGKQTVQPDAEVSHSDWRTKSIYEVIVEASAYNFVTRAARPEAEGPSYFSSYIKEMFVPIPDPSAHITHKEEREENLRKTHIEITKQKITPTRQEGGKVKEYDIGSVGGERLQLRETTVNGKITFNLEEIMKKGGSCSISVSRKPDASGKAGHDIIEILDGKLRIVALSEVGESKIDKAQLDGLVQMQKSVEQRSPQYKPHDRGRGL